MKRPSVDMEELVRQAQALRDGIRAARDALCVMLVALDSLRPPKAVRVAGAVACVTAALEVQHQKAAGLAEELDRQLDRLVASAKVRPQIGLVGGDEPD